MPALEAMPVVRAVAQRGLELDPSLPEANGSLGMVAGVYDYNWKEATQRRTVPASPAAQP
jgi:hypothetical protein